METPLLFLIVLLSGAICALGGFWFYRSSQERKQSVRQPQIARRAARHDLWERAALVYRDEA